MSYLALYRKHRPQDFSEVVEQTAVVKTLKNAIKFDRIAHAYIFSGPRGTGKTSLARIFSKALNCTNFDSKNIQPCNKCASCLAITKGDHMDVIEIDAASNTSVDNVRDLIEKVSFLPSMGKYKIYIVDETHMLSNSAFNALLKTIEEPPKHVLFIFATTAPNKIPVTIQSRCQRLDFIKLSQNSIIERLNKVVMEEKINISNEALKMIAKLSGGHMRDAFSIFDQVLAFSEDKIEIENVLNLSGSVNIEEIAGLLKNILGNELNNYFTQIEDMFYRGLDSVRFVSDIIEFYRYLLLAKLELFDLIVIPNEMVETVKDISISYSRDQILDIIKKLSAALQEIRYLEDARVYIEILLCEVVPVVAKTESKAGSRDPKGEIREPRAESREPKKLKSPLSVDLVNIKHHWPDIIARLKKQRKIRLAAYLMEGTPFKFEDGVVQVGFKYEYKFHCEKLQEIANSNTINSIASEVFSNAIVLKYKIVDKDTLPADLRKDEFAGDRPLEKEKIPKHVQKIAAAFEGKVVKNK